MSSGKDLFLFSLFCVLPYLFAFSLSLSSFKVVAAFGVTLGKEDLLRVRTQSRYSQGKAVMGREARRKAPVSSPVLLATSSR